LASELGWGVGGCLVEPPKFLKKVKNYLTLSLRSLVAFKQVELAKKVAKPQ